MLVVFDVLSVADDLKLEALLIDSLTKTLTLDALLIEERSPAMATAAGLTESFLTSLIRTLMVSSLLTFCMIYRHN